MFEIVNENTLKEFEDFVLSHPKGHFLQSQMWAKVKESWTRKAICVRDSNGAICGGMSLLIRKIPLTPYTLMYSPRGPVCDVHDESTLRALADGAAQLAKKYKAYALRLDPDVKSEDTTFIKIMKDIGFKHKIGDKNFDGVQPNYVFRLDIKDKTKEQIMEDFHHKTRYNIRLSVRKEVVVEIKGKEALPDFVAIMEETGTRDGFITRPLAYFETMLDAFGDNARLYMAYWQGKPIAGTLAIYYGNKVWYLYGASSNSHRNVMPNYQLQWEMICWAVECGCDIYDFRGVSGDLSPENPLYGLYLFKKGFSGEFCEFCGEFEFVYNSFADTAINKMLPLARKMQRKLLIKKKK